MSTFYLTIKIVTLVIHIVFKPFRQHAHVTKDPSSQVYIDSETLIYYCFHFRIVIFSYFSQNLHITHVFFSCFYYLYYSDLYFFVTYECLFLINDSIYVNYLKIYFSLFIGQCNFFYTFTVHYKILIVCHLYVVIYYVNFFYFFLSFFYIFYNFHSQN